MGVWGPHPFDNDDAAEWVDGLASVDDLSHVESAFDAVDVTDDYIEAPTASAALAAAEVVARLLGRRGAAAAAVDGWVAANPQPVPPEVLRRAVRAIDRIVDDDSELAELWRERDDAGDLWDRAVADLRARLLA